MNACTPLFWCPVRELCPAWLIEFQRDFHVVEQHPGVLLPVGSGLAEWRARRSNKA